MATVSKCWSIPTISSSPSDLRRANRWVVLSPHFLSSLIFPSCINPHIIETSFIVKFRRKSFSICCCIVFSFFLSCFLFFNSPPSAASRLWLRFLVSECELQKGKGIYPRSCSLLLTEGRRFRGCVVLDFYFIPISRVSGNLLLSVCDIVDCLRGDKGFSTTFGATVVCRRGT